MHKLKLYLIIYCILSFYTNVISNNHTVFNIVDKEDSTDQNINSENENEEDTLEIDIFIHGTADGIAQYSKHFGTSASFQGFCNHVKSKILDKKTNQELYIDNNKFANFKNRKENILKKDFPTIMGIAPGLSEITHHFENCKNNNKCANCISKISYDSIFLLFKKNKEESVQSKTKYYMFNWVGNLSTQDRKIAADQFNQEFQILSKKYPNAKKNIYTHSHGGNVLLISASLKPLDNINNIFLLAMPLGTKTKQLIEKINCKQIYNIYSNEDIAQNKDITFDIKTFFIGRQIKNNNIKNIEVKRKDKKKVHHGMFNIVDIKNSINPVISDLPLLIYFLENTNKNNQSIIDTEDYIYTLS